MNKELCEVWVKSLFDQVKEEARLACNGEMLIEAISVQDEIITALELKEQFERAQIITGGRLNGSAYAYKCGLEDGKKAANLSTDNMFRVKHI